MSQVTLYLDEETERRMRAAARAAGLSISRWAAGAIRARIAAEWPASVIKLAGAWKDMPEATEIRDGEGEDLPREPL